MQSITTVEPKVLGFNLIIFFFDYNILNKMNYTLGLINLCILLFIVFNIYIKIKNISFNDILSKSKEYNYDKLGDEYFYGVDNDRPNYIKAIENYNKVFLYDPDNEKIPQIRQNLNTIINATDTSNTSKSIMDNIDFGIYNDPNDYIINIDLNAIPLTILTGFQTFIDYNNFENNNFENIIFENNNFENNNNLRVGNDAQNVHDSLVNKTIESSISKLEESTTQNINLDEVNKFLLGKLKDNKMLDTDKDKVKKTIQYIKDNSNSSVRNRKLEDNLVLIGNRIKNNESEEQKNNMIDNLYNELKDCVQLDGNMYCNTGIANRIINSLNGVDESVIITPKWALREELMRKCGKIREELEKINSSNDEDFTEKLKDNIKKGLKKDYVDDNKILSEIDLNKEINEWIEYV